jgi:hypothetical protein
MPAENFMRLSSIALAVAAFTCLLSANDAQAFFGRKKAPEPLMVTADTSSDAIQKTLQSSGKKLSLASGQELMIGAFAVSFVNHHHRGTTRGGGGFGSRASLDVELNLVDLSHETMQAIADQAYAAFVADLTAQGFVVKSLSETEAMAGFKEAQAVGEASGKQVTDSGMKALAFAPSGYTVLTGAHRLQSGLHGDITGGTLQTLNSIGQGADVMRGAKALQTFAANNSMPMLDVSLVLDFADMESKGSSSNFSESVEIASNLGVHVNKLNTYVSLVIDGKVEQVRFQSPVRSEGGAIASVEDISKAKSNITMGIVNAMVGQGSSSRFVKRAIHADEEGFQAQSLMLIDKVGEGMIEALMK